MAITVKEIARLAGVSIGTVDRALHNRGRVKPEIAMRINEIARENGYEPSRVGRALAMHRKPVKIGIVVHLIKTEFMRQVLAGIKRAIAELEGLGTEILLREIPSLDTAAQLEALDELEQAGVQGIAISPSEDDALRRRLNTLITEENIPVITFNTDMSGLDRICFVGLDNMRSGMAAAGLMGAITGGRGKVAILTGHLTNQASNSRIDGFTREIAESFPNIYLTGVQLYYDDDAMAERITAQVLETVPDLAGILVCAGAQSGVCAGLKQNPGKKVHVLTYDLIPATIEGLKSGAIDFVIDQNAYLQGYRPAMLLYEKLFNNREPAQKFLYTDIIIKTKYNL